MPFRALLVALSTLVLAFIAQTALAQPTSPGIDSLAAPGLCTPDPVNDAIVQLMASQQSGRVRVMRGEGGPAILVEYDHSARVISLVDANDRRTRVSYTLQEAQNAAITVTLSDASGTRISSVLAPELGFARVIAPNAGAASDGNGGPFGTISAPRVDAPRTSAIMERFGLTAPPDDRCEGLTAICTAEFNRMMSFGFLCAISIGGDIDSCNGASDARCAWCDCKGYNCNGC